MYGKRFEQAVLAKAYQAEWEYDDRRANLTWDTQTDNGLTNVYYMEYPLSKQILISP